MWTPKRVLLLLSGFAAFIGVYVVYAFWLGGIDGLPPLPREYAPPDGAIEPITDTRPTPEAERKLELAFGANWQNDLRCPLQVEVPKNNLVLATKDIDTRRADGRVKIEPFNVAILGKQEPGRAPEINTIRSESALLTFERPITNITDMTRYKVIACELQDSTVSGIRIRNNRRTTQGNDDISLMTPGPLFYVESKHLIYTAAPVRLIDEQTKPEQSTIEAVGMELKLTTEPEPKPSQPVAAAKPKKNQSISGVESIHLLSAVDMHLWVESSGFLGGNTEKPATPNQPAEIPKLHITTQGPFHYYVSQDDEKAPDRAVFELPPTTGQLAEKVTVTRIAGPQVQQKRDQLNCDRLELTFRRKADGAAPREGSSVNLAIQDAHATGKQVELHSDTDMLDAVGNDFYYDARTKRSTLKAAKEMWALKDGHEIFARELQIDTGQKDVHQAKAVGPGRINMLDRATGKRNLHARWTDGLDFNKEGPYDCLTLRGDAIFEDTDNPQKLQANTIKLWLMPADRDAPTTTEPQKVRPHHLKAIGHVTAVSPDMLIRWADEFTIWFKDVVAPPPAPAIPAGSAVQAPATASAGIATTSPAATPAAAKPNVGAAAPSGPASMTRGLIPATPGDKNKKPLELSARSVEAHVLRIGDKNELDRVSCEGTVHVHQDPAQPEDKGVDISGDSLTLTHHVEGSILVVMGNLAIVQLNKLTIHGPEVKIDQKSNIAWVNGIGAMQMLTEKSFEGEKLEQPTELTVHWQKAMFFDGVFADFQGHVQAEQKNSRLLCDHMQAFLDRRVSFKEGEKSGQSSSVRKMVCDKEVIIDDETREGSKLTRKTRLKSPAVDMSKEDNVLNASGPGVLKILQLGDKDDTLGGGGSSTTPKQKTEKELTLTHVTFRGSMYGDNHSRLAVFLTDVEVVHVPTDSIDAPIDVNKPLPGMMTLHCEKKLKILTHRFPDGRSSQEMEAERKVTIEGQEFSGRCDMLKYDESKQLIILEGSENGLATLYQVHGKGGKPDTIRAKKIFYYRNKNQVHVEESTGISIIK